MNEGPRRCTSCGADAPRAKARYCEQCGERLPERAAASAAEEPALPADAAAADVTAPGDAAPGDASPGDVAARFSALRDLPDLDARLALVPNPPELEGSSITSLLLLFPLILVGLLISWFTLMICPPLGFVPLALVVLGTVFVAGKLLRNARSSTVSQPSLIVSMRTQLQAGAEHSHSNTRHFVGLQDERGSRREHECLASALESLEVGRMGIAYLNQNRVVAFADLPV